MAEPNNKPNIANQVGGTLYNVFMPNPFNLPEWLNATAWTAAYAGLFLIPGPADEAAVIGAATGGAARTATTAATRTATTAATRTAATGATRTAATGAGRTAAGRFARFLGGNTIRFGAFEALRNMFGGDGETGSETSDSSDDAVVEQSASSASKKKSGSGVVAGRSRVPSITIPKYSFKVTSINKQEPVQTVVDQVTNIASISKALARTVAVQYAFKDALYADDKRIAENTARQAKEKKAESISAIDQALDKALDNAGNAIQRSLRSDRVRGTVRDGLLLSLVTAGGNPQLQEAAEGVASDFETPAGTGKQVVRAESAVRRGIQTGNQFTRFLTTFKPKQAITKFLKSLKNVFVILSPQNILRNTIKTGRNLIGGARNFIPRFTPSGDKPPTRGGRRGQGGRSRVTRGGRPRIPPRAAAAASAANAQSTACLLYTSPSPRDGLLSRMPSSA